MKKTLFTTLICVTALASSTANAASPLPFLGDEVLRGFNCKEQVELPLSASLASAACHHFKGTANNKDKALSELSTLSSQGVGEATYLLGVASAQDTKKENVAEMDVAMQFLAKSETQGFHLAKVSMAQVALAAKEYAIAKRLLLEAEKEKVPYASVMLSASYNQGLSGVLKPDVKKSCEYAKKASEAGIPDGHALLGVCYTEGKGVPLNLEKGKALLEKAIAEGSTIGQVAAILLMPYQQ